MLDVVILTKNACKRKGKETFVQCLNRIYEALPVHHLIVVDGYSTDETLSIIRKYDQKYENILLFYDRRGRGKARELGMSKVDTPWFVFVDSDVVLHSDWFHIVSKYVKADVGAVEGELKVPESIEAVQFRNAMKALKRKIQKQEPRSLRTGFFGNVIIRTACVRDITIPKILHSGEDRYIKEWVAQKGFRWVVTDEEVGDHHPEPVDFKTSLLQRGAYGRILKHSTFNNLFYKFLQSFPKGLYASIKFKNINTLVFAVSKHFLILEGWLKWKNMLPHPSIDQKVETDENLLDK